MLLMTNDSIIQSVHLAYIGQNLMKTFLSKVLNMRIRNPKEYHVCF